MRRRTRSFDTRARGRWGAAGGGESCRILPQGHSEQDDDDAKKVPIIGGTLPTVASFVKVAGKDGNGASSSSSSASDLVLS